MNIRKEKSAVIQKIWNTNSEVFGTDAEANLVNNLRNNGIPFLSLVYEEHHDLKGHILFTPVEIAGDTGMCFSGL